MQPHQEVKNGTKKPSARSTRSVASRTSRVIHETRGARQSLVRTGNPWATGLGMFSVGLGVAELLAPGPLARLIGVKDCPSNRLSLRLAGARELAVGAGLMTRRRPTRWLWSRVLGDVADLAMLGTALTKSRRAGAALPVAMAAVAGVTAVDLWASYWRAGEDGASGVSAGPSVPVRAVVTIDRPASEIYNLWRDFENLPRFMSHLRSVEVRDERTSHWTVSATGRDRLEWDAVITQDRPNQYIAWRSVEGADVEHAGEVRFVPAPGNRGTEVHLTMNVLPPAGVVGKAGAKLAHRVPEQLIAADLRRLKQLMELGEIVKSDASLHDLPHPARPAGESGKLEAPTAKGAEK